MDQEAMDQGVEQEEIYLSGKRPRDDNTTPEGKRPRNTFLDPSWEKEKIVRHITQDSYRYIDNALDEVNFSFGFSSMVELYDDLWTRCMSGEVGWYHVRIVYEKCPVKDILLLSPTYVFSSVGHSHLESIQWFVEVHNFPLSYFHNGKTMLRESIGRSPRVMDYLLSKGALQFDDLSTLFKDIIAFRCMTSFELFTRYACATDNQDHLRNIRTIVVCLRPGGPPIPGEITFKDVIYETKLFDRNVENDILFQFISMYIALPTTTEHCAREVVRYLHWNAMKFDNINLKNFLIRCGTLGEYS